MKLRFHAIRACLAGLALLAAPTARGETVSLEQALALARSHNPTLPQFEANLAVARAAILTARAYPNPELELQAGMARSREAEGGNEAEFGIGLTQPIELPGKRRTRREAAEAELPVVHAEAEGYLATLRAETARAYRTLAFQAASLALAEADAANAGELYALVERRVSGGEAAEIDRVKTRVEMLKAQRRVRHAMRQRNAARIALNALCGGALPAQFETPEPLPTTLTAADAGQARLTMEQHNPEYRRLAAEEARGAAVLRREQKAWHPDLRPGVSLGREADADTFAVTLGFEMPLWNRNQGGVAEAEAAIQAAEAERQRSSADLERELQLALEAQTGAVEQLAGFDTELRSGAAEALRIETLLYEQGEHDLLQLIDARRTAQETEAEYLQALYDANIAQIELEHAIGIGGEA